MKYDTEWFMPLYFTGKKYVFHDITYLAGRNKKILNNTYLILLITKSFDDYQCRLHRPGEFRLSPWRSDMTDSYNEYQSNFSFLKKKT